MKFSKKMVSWVIILMSVELDGKNHNVSLLLSRSFSSEETIKMSANIQTKQADLGVGWVDIFLPPPQCDCLFFSQAPMPAPYMARVEYTSSYVGQRVI